MKRQTGSAMKPIAVLLPAMSKKMITNVTVFSDEPTTFTDYNNELYSPINYDGYKGSITLRQAVESSQNIPFVKIMEDLTPQVSIKYLKKMGITTLNENDINLALSLGGLDEGISPLEFAGGYATIANNGVYIEPTFYLKIDSISDSTILKSKQKKKRVVSKDVACILKQLLTEPVTGSNGTATYCSVSGMDIAAKTGTTNDNYDRWLCGFSPYYTTVCWYGFDINESVEFNKKNPAGLIWASVMRNIHYGLNNAKFEMSNGVLTSTICRESGKVANSGCKDTFTEYFLKGTIPDICTMHSGSKITTNKNNNSNSTTSNSTNNNKTYTPPSSSENDEISNNTTDNSHMVNSTTNTHSNNTTTQNQNTTSNTTQNTSSNNATNNSSSVNNSTSTNNTSSSSNITNETTNNE